MQKQNLRAAITCTLCIWALLSIQFLDADEDASEVEQPASSSLMKLHTMFVSLRQAASTDAALMLLRCAKSNTICIKARTVCVNNGQNIGLRPYLICKLPSTRLHCNKLKYFRRLLDNFCWPKRYKEEHKSEGLVGRTSVFADDICWRHSDVLPATTRRSTPFSARLCQLPRFRKTHTFDVR